MSLCPGSNSWWPEFWGLGLPCERSRWSCRLQASLWPSPNLCSHLRTNQQTGLCLTHWLAHFLSLFAPSLFFKVMKIKYWKENVQTIIKSRIITEVVKIHMQNWLWRFLVGIKGFCLNSCSAFKKDWPSYRFSFKLTIAFNHEFQYWGRLTGLNIGHKSTQLSATEDRFRSISFPMPSHPKAACC